MSNNKKSPEETTEIPSHIEFKEQVYQDKNQIIQKVIAQFNAHKKEYYVSDHGDRAALLAIRNDTVLLVKQYRLLINGISLEIPGGKKESKESPEEAAIRECFEETGVKCKELKKLLFFQPSLDIWKNPTQIYTSEKFSTISEVESRKHTWIPLDECVNKIFSGKITDGLSIIAILAFYTRKIKIK